MVTWVELIYLNNFKLKHNYLCRTLQMNLISLLLILEK